MKIKLVTIPSYTRKVTLLPIGSTGRPPNLDNQWFLVSLEEAINLNKAVSVQVPPADIKSVRTNLIQLAYRHHINLHSVLSGKDKIIFWKK